jgi:hypothetical protein
MKFILLLLLFQPNTGSTGVLEYHKSFDNFQECMVVLRKNLPIWQTEIRDGWVIKRSGCLREDRAVDTVIDNWIEAD